MISGSNEQLQQQLEYTLLNPDCHCWWISKMQSGREDTLEEWYAMKLCFKIGKNATETSGILQTAFGASCMNLASVFEWHKRFKEGQGVCEGWCGRSKEVNTPELIGQRIRVTMFRKEIPSEEVSTLQIGSVAFPPGQYKSPHSILGTIWPKWSSRQFLSLPLVQTLLPVAFVYSLSWVAVVMRQLRRWKKLWRRSLTRSHKRTSMGPSRSCWNGTTSALQPESGNLYNDPRIYTFSPSLSPRLHICTYIIIILLLWELYIPMFPDDFIPYCVWQEISTSLLDPSQSSNPSS